MGFYTQPIGLLNHIIINLTNSVWLLFRSFELTSLAIWSMDHRKLEFFCEKKGRVCVSVWTVVNKHVPKWCTLEINLNSNLYTAPVNIKTCNTLFFESASNIWMQFISYPIPKAYERHHCKHDILSATDPGNCLKVDAVQILVPLTHLCAWRRPLFKHGAKLGKVQPLQRQERVHGHLEEPTCRVWSPAFMEGEMFICATTSFWILPRCLVNSGCGSRRGHIFKQWACAS